MSATWLGRRLESLKKSKTAIVVKGNLIKTKQPTLCYVTKASLDNNEELCSEEDVLDDVGIQEKDRMNPCSSTAVALALELGTLHMDESFFQGLWESFENPANATQFVKKCIQYLLKDDTAVSPSLVETNCAHGAHHFSLEPNQKIYFHQCLLNTIHILLLYHDIHEMEDAPNFMDLLQSSTRTDELLTKRRNFLQRSSSRLFSKRCDDLDRSIRHDLIPMFQSYRYSFLFHALNDCTFVLPCRKQGLWYRIDMKHDEFMQSLSNGVDSTDAGSSADAGGISTTETFSTSSSSFASSMGKERTRDIDAYFMGNSPFTYLYLKQKILKNESSVHQVYDDAVRLLAQSIQSVSMQPQLFQNKIFALLHLLREILRLRPTSSEKRLKYLYDALKRLRSWPINYATYAKRLEDMVALEIISPGNAAREEALEWYATVSQQQLVIHHHEVEEGARGCNQNEHQVIDFFRVPYFFSRKDPQSKPNELIASILQQFELNEGFPWTKKKRGGDERSTGTSLLKQQLKDFKIDFLLSFLQCEIQWTKEECLRFQRACQECSAEDLNRCFDHSVRVHQLSTKKSTRWQAKEWRESHAAFLCRSILPGMSLIPKRFQEDEHEHEHELEYEDAELVGKGTNLGENQSSIFDAPFSLPPRPLDDLYQEGKRKVNEFPLCPIPKFPKATWFQPTELSEVCLVGKMSHGSNEKDGISTSWLTLSKDSMKSFIYSQDDLDALKHLFQYSTQHLHVSRVPIIILGGNETMHRLLCAYVALHRYFPHLAALKPTQVFVLPDGENYVAQHLSQIDGWYSRYVYSPFVHDLPVFPQAKPKTKPHCNLSSLTRSTQNTLEAFTLEAFPLLTSEAAFLPALSRAQFFQEYVGTATHVHSISVFECQVWGPGSSKTDETSPASFKSIPFAARVDVNRSSQLESHMMQPSKTWKKSFAQVSQLFSASHHKSALPNPLRSLLRLRYQVVNQKGVALYVKMVDLKANVLNGNNGNNGDGGGDNGDNVGVDVDVQPRTYCSITSLPLKCPDVVHDRCMEHENGHAATRCDASLLEANCLLLHQYGTPSMSTTSEVKVESSDVEWIAWIEVESIPEQGCSFAEEDDFAGMNLSIDGNSFDGVRKVFIQLASMPHDVKLDLPVMGFFPAE